MSEYIRRRLESAGPKRILALDGGGVRGIVSIGFLEAIEAVLAKRFVSQGIYQRSEDFRLAHYFDLIGGTSVGSMLATMLALGWPMSQVRREFEAEITNIFKSRQVGGFIRPKYNAGPVFQAVHKIVGDQPLRSEQLQTGLAIIIKRADKGSVWPIVNNPNSKWWNSNVDNNGASFVGNGDYKLWQLLRASTAAPTYFSAMQIDVLEGPDDDKGFKGMFVDGGVSPHNNPALQMLLLAGLKGYNLGGPDYNDNPRAWRLGANNLQIISVGAGSYAHAYGPRRVCAQEGIDALFGVISDTQELALTLLQWFSRPRLAWEVDSEIGNLNDDILGLTNGFNQPLLDFQRYDVRLENKYLKNLRQGQPELSEEQLTTLRDFTNPGQVSTLSSLAKRAAQTQVQSEHFARPFDGLWQDNDGFG